MIILVSLGVLGAIVVVIVGSLGGTVPQSPELEQTAGSDSQVPAAEEIESLLVPPDLDELKPATGKANPFFTEHYLPPEPKPEPEPEEEEEDEEPEPPPEPETREVRLTYVGYLRSSEGELQAYVRVDDQWTRGPLGAILAENWRLESLEAQSIRLLNLQTEEAVEVGFAETKTVEIPIEKE